LWKNVVGSPLLREDVEAQEWGEIMKRDKKMLDSHRGLQKNQGEFYQIAQQRHPGKKSLPVSMGVGKGTKL